MVSDERKYLSYNGFERKKIVYFKFGGCGGLASIVENKKKVNEWKKVL